MGSIECFYYSCNTRSLLIYCELIILLLLMVYIFICAVINRNYRIWLFGQQWVIEVHLSVYKVFLESGLYSSELCGKQVKCRKKTNKKETETEKQVDRLSGCRLVVYWAQTHLENWMPMCTHTLTRRLHEYFTYMYICISYIHT